MTLPILTGVYVAIGVVLALLALRRGRGAADAALVVLAWPLYAPALRGDGHAMAPLDEPAHAALAVREALASVREAAEGSPFSTLLGAAAEARLCAEIDRAAARMRAIDHEVSATVVGHSGRATTTASLHADSLASLRALRAADAAAMSELADLLGALRSRIVLARHAGSSADGPGAIVAEVWARIEGLGEAFSCTADVRRNRTEPGVAAARPASPA